MNISPGLRTLCFDFGNTRQKAAVFSGDELAEVFTIDAGDLLNDAARVAAVAKPHRIILSSVIAHPAVLEKKLKAMAPLHILSAGSRLPITTPVGKPETIGADRLALCSAAVYQFPQKNNLIIGLGSAVTYNFVNVKHEFLGGGISPGLLMRMKALNSYTHLLPIVEPAWHIPLVGYDTATNIQSGVILGLAYEIDGMIDSYARQYGAFNVLLTGGDLAYLSPHIKNLIFADPHLLFKGLYAICNQNLLPA